MHGLRLLTGFIGISLTIFYSGLSFAQAEPSTTFTGENKMVTVEPNNVITAKSRDGTYDTLPYAQRRPSWGKTFSVSYSNFEPEGYQPNYIELPFNEIYGSAETPMIELEMAIKKNASSFSYGAEVSAGIYKNESDQPLLTESSLQLVPIKLGAIVLLDAYRDEPLFVPYISGGAYMVLYEEDNNNASFKGNTQPAPYFNLGLAISLDWIDRSASRISYQDSGIEASYAFVEARTLFEAGDEQDPNFGSDINFAAGLKIEF